ncbi:5'/3'-nucleotidase SurE [Oculatella sp. FACHB-28]|uniref:5'/3'-nucleotidase SurE n=1 Tax=Cyanophyceae TaxID=3028117 RepID=UPI0016864DDA|nr:MULTISPECIES: 5'/3'-nucleotidase SurE [Cyanophyceae]MBD1999531.1 5'/3'-nucleotidase SurE [Leptolyngbya sp. FACHB-541]MBD2059841.1 5'/3'-nucleotidase SurE [Oculatella sp. FACHB-28]MBD2072129.1 5'/3'-nucleotidase SurE [Leptolyngbya sp. FACHB-671]
MNLLISNDDGIFAQGIRTLANTLAAAGHQVTVVCPDRERSATGHGLTIHDPIRVEAIDSIFHPTVRAWACSGTPSDCVKLALGGLMDSPPEIVLSGINHGSNLGTDVLYSGTVSAAMEGLIEGIPSIAFSLASSSTQDFQPAANFAQTLVDRISRQPLPSAMLLNVNIPAVRQQDIIGVALTRQGIRRYFDTFEKRIDPRGKTYYWLAGELIEEISEPDQITTMAGVPDLNLEWANQTMTDVQAIRQNYITVTPLQYNLTCKLGLANLKDWQLNFFKNP